jgi:hypothetical protein
VSALFLTACGSGNDSGGSNAGSGTGSNTESSATPTPTPTKPAAPTYRILNKQELTGALLGVQDMPAGYSQDPPTPDSLDKTFCDYKPPFTQKVKVSRDFTKGGGMSAELLRVGLRQYANPQQAKAAFDALTKALETCAGETYDGTKMTYTPMSAPKVGDASIGVKITADDTPLLQTFALVGPTLVNSGGGGLMNASADDVNTLLEAQVKAYKNAATK